MDSHANADGPAGIFGALGELYENINNNISSLECRINVLEAQNRELEERLALLLAERTQDRTDLFGEGHVAHLGLAAEYRTLVVQWMQRVARKFVTTKTRKSLELELGRLVADFTAHLFGSVNPDVDALMSSFTSVDSESRRIAQSMCHRAVSLRARIEEIGILHEWDFRTDSSGNFDDTRQEAWLTCDPNLTVRLVVAPAYVVQGQVYAKQFVITGAS